MSNRRESDYRVETCGEEPEGREAAGKGVQMSETWERLLNREFKTRGRMLLHFLHKRPVMSAFHQRHAGEMLRNGVCVCVCVALHTNVRLSDFLLKRMLTEDGEGGMKDGVCVRRRGGCNRNPS